jgi:hypothetical protein
VIIIERREFSLGINLGRKEIKMRRLMLVLIDDWSSPQAGVVIDLSADVMTELGLRPNGSVILTWARAVR